MFPWDADRQPFRFQLRETPVAITELAPPYEQTDMLGVDQALAMPLTNFIAEAMQLFGNLSPPRARFSRAVSKYPVGPKRNGDYDQRSLRASIRREGSKSLIV